MIGAMSFRVPELRITRTVECAVLFIDVRKSSEIVRFVERHHGSTAAAELFTGFLAGSMQHVARSSTQECRPSGDAVLATFIGRRRVQDSVQAALDAIRFVHDEINVTYRRHLTCPGGCGDPGCPGALRFDVGAGIDDGVITVSSLPGQGLPQEQLTGSCVSLAAKLSDAARPPDYIAMAAHVYQRERPPCTSSYEWRQQVAVVASEQRIVMLARRVNPSHPVRPDHREERSPLTGLRS
jgi:class 3 adenylate cyclase